MSVGNDSLISVVPTAPSVGLDVRESICAEEEEDTNLQDLRGNGEGLV